MTSPPWRDPDDCCEDDTLELPNRWPDPDDGAGAGVELFAEEPLLVADRCCCAGGDAGFAGELL